MTKSNRQQDIERICKYFGYTAEYVTLAAQQLGRLRGMNEEEIATCITDLEDEVVRHLQVSQAITLAHDIPIV